ncbi:MAG TPA: 1,2-phenylacetyl-CoA epoxidase subunit PaaD [Sphingobacteriaceae bacterium]|nr:1,2-phenylacetyl-CoA epoxidase subunit PaaD [Sphingobacteriaceae bacterium]
MVDTIWKYLEEVPDPEIPVISVIDLGVVRGVKLLEPNGVRVTITPTYSGCPAMNEISMGIRLKLMEKGFEGIEVVEQLSPAWTTEWLSESGKEKMKAYGIAPPVETSREGGLFAVELGIACPQCGSNQTKLISQFGSTACKALYQCQACREPFDYFKCHH